MEPQEYDIEFPRGDTLPLSIEITDSDGEVLEPTAGDEVYFTVKKSYRSQDVIFQKRYSRGEIVFENNEFVFCIEHKDTAELSYGRYYYDIQIKSGDFVKTLLIGMMTLTNEATWLRNE